MQQNAEYAKLFRGRPLRFVLPLTQSNSKKSLSFANIRRSLSETSGINLLTSMFKKQNMSFDSYEIDCEQGYNRPTSEDKRIEALLATNLIKLPHTNCTAIKLSDGTVFCKPEILCTLGCETPRINYEKHLAVKYRYFYAISSDVDAENPGTLIKVDTITKSFRTWCERNCYPSEPIFVASPDSNVSTYHSN